MSTRKFSIQSLDRVSAGQLKLISFDLGIHIEGLHSHLCIGLVTKEGWRSSSS